MLATPRIDPRTDYTRFLREELERRVQLNPRYSLRSFARDLGITPPNLSLILREKKGLSLDSATRVALRIGLSDEETALFCDLVAVKHARSSTVRRIVEIRLRSHYAPHAEAVQNSAQQISLDVFRTISDWYHYALLELTETKNFRRDPLWMAKRLGISVHEVNSAIERLLRLNLLTLHRGRLKKNAVQLLSGDEQTLETTKSSEGIQRFNRQIFTKALEALTQQSTDERDFITMTVAANPKKLKAAGIILRDCRQKITDKLEEGERTEVLCVSMQIMRLSKVVKEKS